MPTVPWIRLYQNWPRHRKTVALRKALGTADPVLSLWLWAAENAPNGDLGHMSSEEIEDAAGWQGKRGRAAAAMVETGFIDVADDGSMALHNWERRAGRGVASLIRSRERSRDVMRNVRSNKARNEPRNPAETLSLSPDLSSGSSLPLSAPDPDRSNGRAKSAHDWIEFFKVRYREKTGQFYGHGAVDGKAEGNLGDLLTTLPGPQRAEDWEARERIVGEFLARTDPRTVSAGWPFAFFVTDFRALAIPPEKRPKARGVGSNPPMSIDQILKAESAHG